MTGAQDDRVAVLDGTVSSLSADVKDLTAQISKLERAFTQRTRTRSVLTVAAAIILAMTGIIGGLVIVNNKVQRHADSDNASWCVVWDFISEQRGTDTPSGLFAREEYVRRNCTR